MATSNNNGLLTGTPATQGSFQVTVQVQDSASPPATVAKTFTVAFAFPPLPAITVTPTQVTLPGYPLALRGTLQLTFAPNAAGLPANFTNAQLVFAQNSQASIQIDIPGAQADQTRGLVNPVSSFWFLVSSGRLQPETRN